MIGLGSGGLFYPALGGDIGPPPPPPPPPPMGPATLPFDPTARWHPGHSTVVTNADRVVSASDLRGLANVSEGAAGIGPKAMTDALGQKFWRFEGAEFLNVAAGLVCDSRDVTVLMVGRVPRHPASNNRYLSLGNRAQGSHVNTLGDALGSRVYARSAGHLQSFGKIGYTASTDAEWMVPGAQMQVIGAATSGSGTRLLLNERFADVAVAYNRTGVSGAEIGRYAWSPGSSGNWGVFDLYEMVVYAPGLSYADAQTVSAALMQAHTIAPVTNQLVLEGDSIMQGTGDVTHHLSAAAILTEPGMERIPAGWRVINKGTSGNQVSDLVLKRDANNSWADQILPGRNVMAFEIGRNDWSGHTAAEHYANVVAYLNTPTTGVLQKGWEARVMANIATAPGLMTKTIAHRAALRDAQFLTDVGSTGQVSIISTDLIAHNGQTRFEDATDAADTTYYAGDNTHPNLLGAEIRLTGGDTPQYGVTVGL